jgi:Membrane protein involved in the export of O-antigen and teichoic acid
MIQNKLKKKIIYAAKWSTITEIVSRIISPVSTMILARILAPEAFGVVATATMIFSFADMFTDAGFEKYLVQHEFKDEKEKLQNAHVAFWTNFGLSVLLWGIIACFNNQIAALVGNPGLGNVIIIACLQLPLTSFTCIQIALYRRDFDFKTLFGVRLITILVPFVLTIPLALYGMSYWALIIGTIIGQLCNAIILTVRSKWKPKFFYKIKILKEMISFSIWTLVEAISIWLTSWVDVFIIGSIFNQYYTGLYKLSTTMVNGITGVITAATVPVLFATLSRMQNDNTLFKQIYFKAQRLVAIFIFPLGMGLFLYSDLATKLLLGNQWNEASGIIGTWALTSSIMIVFSYFCSEVYRSKGKPKLSFLAQVLHLVVLIPVCIIYSQQGFWPLVYARSWVRIEAILVDFIIMYFLIEIPVMETFKNVIPMVGAAAVMGVLGYLLRQVNSGIIFNIISVIICAFVYFGILNLFPSMRKDLYELVQKIKPGKLKSKPIVSES